MPSSPRSAQVDLDATPFYHCIGRCVRRAFLCGLDAYTGESFEHRKAWFLHRVKAAAEAFAIDVCAYAIMSNHFHVVLRVDRDRANGWSDEAVLRRYAKFFPNAARRARELPKSQQAARITEIRDRLTSISWFMRVVCEYIARRANAEEDVTGRFWEGRFRSQALLDEAAVATCMSYVDLNPVRAGMATSIAGCSFTSVKQRVDEAGGVARGVTIPLAPMGGEARRDAGRRRVLGIRFDDYLQILDWTGRARRAKPSGTLRGAPPDALVALGVDATAWLATMDGETLATATSLGAPELVDAEATRRGNRWLRGKRMATALYTSAAE